MPGFAEDFPKTFEAIEAGRVAGLHSGAQIYISRFGKALADEGVGESRPGVRMTVDSILLWFSAGKPLTAAAIAKLWEAGRLDLDDPVIRFIPEFGVGGKQSITIRHLLTHTAGVRWVEWSQSWEETLARICAAPIEPRWIPGRTAGYHPFTTWYILGEIIRRADTAGRAFETFIAEEILEPLGMKDSSLSMPVEKYPAYGDRIARIDITNNSSARPAFFDTEEGCSVCSPGGSARGSARELGKFYEMLLGRGRPILLPQTVEALTARHRAGIEDLTFKHIIDWGLGFVVNSAQYKQTTPPYGYGPYAWPRTYGHGGHQSSVGFCDPERGLVVSLIFNGMPGEPAHQKRMLDALTAVYEDLGMRSEI